MDGVDVVKETEDSYITGNFHSPIGNHPFMRYVAEVTPLYIMQHNDMRQALLGGENRDNETIDETLRNSKVMTGDDSKFLADESALVYELGLRLDKVQHVFFMLTYFPKSPDENSLLLTRAEYIEDLLELYVINSIALQDRIIELTAFLYSVKLSRDDAKRKENLYADLAEHLDIVVLLKQLDHIFKYVRKSRNTIIHATSYYDEDLENIFQYEIRYRRERAKRGKHEGDMLKELNRLYDDYERDKLVDLHANNVILEKILIELLDCFYAQHKLRIKALGIKTSIKINSNIAKSSNLRENASIVNAIDWSDIAAMISGKDNAPKEDQ